jgi:hypothetical protein
MLIHRHARVAAWHYIKKNWPIIRELGFWTGELIKSCGELPYSLRTDYVEFCEANVKGIADMNYAQALEDMDLLAEFQARTKEDLTAWLNKATSR